MYGFSLAFFLGVCGILLPFMNFSHWFLLGLMALLFHLLLRKHFTALLLVSCLGLAWVLLFVQVRIIHSFPHILEGKNVKVEGIVDSVPEIHEHYVKFLFKTSKMAGVTDHRVINLDWYTKKILPRAGEKWKLMVRLKRPRGFLDPGAFNYEKYLFLQNISATGYVIDKGDNVLLSDCWHLDLIDHWRQQLQGKIVQVSKGESLWELLPALVVGSRFFITPEQWQILQETGTNHLIAIAGLHIGLVSGFVFFLVYWLWRQIASFSLYVPAKIVAAFFSFFAGLFYSLLAGFPIQTQRALVMLALVLLGVVLRRSFRSSYTLACALIIVLFLNPLVILSESFWLSFVVVSAILYSVNGRFHSSGVFWPYFRVQWVIMIALFPMSLWFFMHASLVAPIANMVAVPCFSFLVVPLVFLGTALSVIYMPLGKWLLIGALKILQYLWVILIYLAHFHSLSLIYHHLASVGVLCSFMLAVILLLMPKGFYGRYLSVIFILPVFMWHDPSPAFGELKFTLLDVGQGLAAVIQTQKHILVYDTGPRFSENLDAGSAVVVPYLRTLNVGRVDIMMVSHGDNDHIGGAHALLQELPVGKILSSTPAFFPGQKFIYCHSGEHWRWDGVDFRVLFPEQNRVYEANNSSCVLQIEVGQNRILLVGDIEKPAENELVSKMGDLLHSFLIVAPHHGSKTSSTLPFLKMVQPQYVLFPIGYRNRFHFPNISVVRRYRALNVHMYDTVHSGAITLYFPLRQAFPSWSFYRSKNREIWAETQDRGDFYGDGPTQKVEENPYKSW